MSDMLGMFGMFAPRGGRAPGASLAPAARLVVCAAVPWYVCLWLGTTADPVPAALPAVLILREDVFEAPRLALQRLVGVVAGVLLSVAVLHRLPPGSLSFLIVLVCGCAGMYLLRQGGSPNQQVLITAMMIYATAEPGYPLARLEESAVGIAVVALLGPLLWPRTPTGTLPCGLDAYRSRPARPHGADRRPRPRRGPNGPRPRRPLRPVAPPPRTVRRLGPQDAPHAAPAAPTATRRSGGHPPPPPAAGRADGARPAVPHTGAGDPDGRHPGQAPTRRCGTWPR